MKGTVTGELRGARTVTVPWYSPGRAYLCWPCTAYRLFSTVPDGGLPVMPDRVAVPSPQ